MSIRSILSVFLLSASFNIISPASAQQCIGECKWRPPCGRNQSCPTYQDPSIYFEKQTQEAWDHITTIGTCSARQNGRYGRPSSYTVTDSECLLCATPDAWPLYCTRSISYYYSDGTLCARNSFIIYPDCDLSAYNNVLQLSPLEGEPESDNVLTSIEPNRTTDTLLAKVVNKRTNEIISNVDIKLELTVKENSGGHIHAEHNPIVTTNVKGSLRSDDSQSIGDDRIFGILEGNTGDQGLQFTYEAPPPAGDIVVTGSCISHYCKQDGADTIWVGIKGLWQIQPSTSVLNPSAVIPCQEKHTKCHYLTRTAYGQLKKLVRKFPGAFPIILHFGDASLERGGLFDKYGDWVVPFAEKHYAKHDQGKAVDIYVKPQIHLDPTDVDYMLSFVVIAAKFGLNAQPIRLPVPPPGFQLVYFHVDSLRHR